MYKVTKDFTTILDKDCTKSCIILDVDVYNKNGTIHKRYGYSQSFSIDEIYSIIKSKYPNKTYKLTITLKA